MRIETKRLIIRPWQQDDLDDFHAYAKVEGVGEAAGWPHHKNLKESQEVLDMFMTVEGNYAIVLQETDKVIGSIGVHIRDAMDSNYAGKKHRQLGYVLSKIYWGKGYMPEAVKAMARYCFETLKLDSLFCGHFDVNNQSKRVCEKCGFFAIGEGVYESKLLKKKFKEIRYVLTKDNYLKLKDTW